ncbi:MAG: MFS transporter [bacterium]|nr:MFS transporter [bacterium]
MDHVEQQKDQSEGGFRRIVRAMRHRNYRLFFAGQGISLIGTWMQQIAVSWLVYRLTNSPFLLGIASFSLNAPVLFLAPIAGYYADRWDRHRLLVILQVLSMVQALAMAALVLTDLITVWQIIILSLFLGVINAFDMPIRQSYIVEMIEDRKDLGNAIALNSTMFNLARLIGPSIAGLMIAAVGEGMVFLVNGLSYIAVIIALMAMTHVNMQAKKSDASLWESVREGVTYSFGFPPIRSLLLLLALVSLIGMPYTVLMPIFARDVLQGDSHTMGFLVGASGVGALIGALYLASRRSVRGLARLVPIAAAVFGAGLIALSFSRNVWLSIGLMVFTGFGFITQAASSNTLLQTIVDDDKRGRVMGLYTLAIRGIAPLGSLLAGAMAASIGAPYTFMLGGLGCILGALIFARYLPAMRQMIRPIYIQKGIVPTPEAVRDPE